MLTSKDFKLITSKGRKLMANAQAGRKSPWKSESQLIGALNKLAR